MIYHIMFKDIEVATADLSKDKTLKYTKLIPDGIKQPINGDVTFLRFYKFLKSRCYEDNRADLKSILEKAEMDWNDPYTWIKKTHGVTLDDFFWIKIGDEKTKWDDIKVR